MYKYTQYQSDPRMQHKSVHLLRESLIVLMGDSGLVILWRVDLCMDCIQNYMGVTIQSFMVRVHESSKEYF